MFFVGILFCQALAFLLAVVCECSKVLQVDDNIGGMPGVMMMVPYYSLLTVNLLIMLLIKRSCRTSGIPIWKAVVCAILDAYANVICQLAVPHLSAPTYMLKKNLKNISGT